MTVRMVDKARVGRLIRSGRGSLYVDRGDGPTMMLLGAGRSGTTWVGAVLARRYRARSIFEPFHPTHVKQLGDFPVRPVLNADSDVPPHHDQIAAVINGRVRSTWTDFGNGAAGKVDRRIIKEIRMCAAAGYLAARFPDVPLIGLARNPLDNAVSRHRLGWPTAIDPAALERLRDAHPDLAHRLEGATTDIGRHVGIWLADTVSLLRGLASGSEARARTMVVSYENLSSGLDVSLECIDIFAGWKPVRLNVPTRLAARPSSNGRCVALGRDDMSDVARVLDGFVDTSDHCGNYFEDLAASAGCPIT